MKSHHVSLWMGIALLVLVQGCSNASDQNDKTRGERSSYNDRQMVVDSMEGCNPTADNNYCRQTAQTGGTTQTPNPNGPSNSVIESCWAKVLDTPSATACATQGKVFNRLTRRCVDLSVASLETPCSEAQVTAAFQAAGFHPDSIATGMNNIKNAIKTAIGVDGVLDQCAKATTSSGKTVLIPLFFGKRYDGGPDGRGKYLIHGGKVCHSSIPACNHESLTFPSGNIASPPVNC